MDFPPFLKPKPRQDFTEGELLKEIEREVGPLPKGGAGAKMPPPVVQRPAGRMPMPSERLAIPVSGMQRAEEEQMLSKEDVSKLPLFMKVEEYDRIVSELAQVSDSLKKMDEILATLTRLEEQESEQTNRWRGQLEITKTQLKQLLAHMPETGKLKEMVEIKKRQAQREKMTREMTGLSRELKKVAPQPAPEISNLQNDLNSLKSELLGLKDDIRMIAEMTRQGQEEKKQAEKASSFPKSEYKKVEGKPW